ncbi:MAG: RNA polymerase sigma factor [Leptospirales bacterium]|nr:RNA polymerase sigma factor [Leptospirales bacterium]
MNEKEFAEFVKNTKKTVLSAIGKNMASRFYHAIDDVAQETYIRAYRAIEKNSFKGDSSIETWLYTIARNESIRMNKKLLREEEKAKRVSAVFDKMESEDDSSDSESTEYLHEHISLLPEKYRDVLTLSSKGFNISDISQELGIPLGTVKSRTARGKKMILENIRRENHERQ